MTTLVTGATGHVGVNLVRALLARGERVRAMVRSGNPGLGLQGLGIERVQGAVQDPAAVRAAVRGCDRVYHLASLVSIRSGDRHRLHDANVVGTRNVLRACRDEGVERVVHTSSIGTIGDNETGPSTEDDYLGPFEPAMDYDLSKAAGEREAMAAALDGLDVVIVNPTAIIGPYDYKPSLIGQTIIDFAHGKVPAYIPGSYDFVPVRDVVAGHMLAMERGRRGHRYLLCGDVVTVERLMGWLAELTGRPKPKLKIPSEIMLPMASAKDWFERNFAPHATPRFNEHSIRMLTQGKHGTNEKARRELGLEPTPAKDAFRDAVEWFRGEGRL